ncbi:hypothetical protein WN944_007574 [Citrus x changshan-huyou]|uniref:Uncharacterized protein n=1 Tax=Citrus x changshan-huyou TaxID=2935761 RepID=A0AAP0MLB1_9ROSI
MDSDHGIMVSNFIIRSHRINSQQSPTNASETGIELQWVHPFTRTKGQRIMGYPCDLQQSL